MLGPLIGAQALAQADPPEGAEGLRAGIDENLQEAGPEQAEARRRDAGCSAPSRSAGAWTNIGLNREDRRYAASLGLIYKLSRSMQLKGELRQSWLRSNVSGVDYTATAILVGLRLQRWG